MPARTVNHELLTLRMIFNRLVDLDVLAKSPARKVKLLDAPVTAPRILTIDEQKVYLMACAQPLRDVAALMIELGLRPSEILNLKRDDISLDEIPCRFRKVKSETPAASCRCRSRAAKFWNIVCGRSKAKIFSRTSKS